MGKHVKFAIVLLCCFLAGNFVGGAPDPDDVYTQCLTQTDPARDAQLSTSTGNGNAGTSPATANPSRTGSKKDDGAQRSGSTKVGSAPSSSTNPIPSRTGSKKDDSSHSSGSQGDGSAPPASTANPHPSRSGPTGNGIAQRSSSETSAQETDPNHRNTATVRPHGRVNLPDSLKSDYKPKSKVYEKCQTDHPITRQAAHGPRSSIFKKCVTDHKREEFKSALFHKCRKVLSLLFEKCRSHGSNEAQIAHKKCHAIARERKAKDIHKKCHSKKRESMSKAIYIECHAGTPEGAAARYAKCNPGFQPHVSAYDEQHQHVEGQDAYDEPPKDEYEDKGNQPQPGLEKKDTTIQTNTATTDTKGKKQRKSCKGLKWWKLVRCLWHNARAAAPIIDRAVTTVREAYRAIFKGKKVDHKKITAPLAQNPFKDDPEDQHPGGGEKQPEKKTHPGEHYPDEKHQGEHYPDEKHQGGHYTDEQHQDGPIPNN